MITVITTALRGVLLGALVLGGSGCLLVSSTPAGNSESTPGEVSIYSQALDMAKNPTPDKIYRGLTPITRDTPGLEWKDIGGVSHVLVSSWVSTFEYYESYLGGPYDTGTYDIWVTAAPAVQQLCSDPAWRGDDVDARLTRYLGLPPGSSMQGFASFWVKPADLFRPCPDNEITDRECGLALPDDVAPWYRKWFNDLRAKQYFVAKEPAQPGWPWTQLGYTFDWQDLSAPIGASEFVIKQHATVNVAALTPTAEYCGMP